MNNFFELINTFIISYDNEWIIEVSSCGDKVLDGSWPQCDSGELRITISNCWKYNA